MRPRAHCGSRSCRTTQVADRTPGWAGVTRGRVPSALVDAHPRLGHADLLTVGEVAAELRVSRTTVHRLIRRGELRAHALGAQYRVTRQDLEAFLSAARA